MTPSLKDKTLQIGHTPDPDDAFMFYGFSSGDVRIPGMDIKHVLEDIETLNKKALSAEIDVTAISTALYPFIQPHYWILPIGASVGRNYGPVVVKKVGRHPSTKRIAIPGKHTTAYLLLRLLTEGYQPFEYRFDDVPRALEAREVDYGLLIHEAQLTYASFGFEKIADLGELWMRNSGLPIPLGLDVVHKDLGKDQALLICNALKESIRTAKAHFDSAVDYALAFGRGLEKNKGSKFINMYVNDDTLELGEDGERALNLLFDRAYRAGIFASPTKVEVFRP